jgi:coenzyme F420 hydrogenase subunit beta
VTTDAGTQSFPLEQIRKLIPHTCFVCPDMTAEWCDLSVGMFEGRPGWNTLIVRTPFGERLVERAVRLGWLIVEQMPREALAGLADAALAKKVRSLRNAERKGLVNRTDESRRPAICIPPAVLKRLLD